jgi:hypothetical protein
MKSRVILGLFCLALAGAIPANAQGHTANLNWTAPSDTVAGSTYNVYRSAGVCPATAPGTLTWTKLTATPVASLSFTDSTITVGAWCYYVTQVQAGIESVPSVPAGGTAQPKTVTFTVVIQ